MRDALSLTDQAIAFGDGALKEDAVRQMLGSVDRSHALRLIGALALGDGRTVVGICDALRRDGLSAASTLEEMSAVLQRMAVLQTVPELPADADDPDAQELARLAAQMPADETQLLYSLCLHGGPSWDWRRTNTRRSPWCCCACSHSSRRAPASRKKKH